MTRSDKLTIAKILIGSIVLTVVLTVMRSQFEGANASYLNLKAAMAAPAISDH